MGDVNCGIILNPDVTGIGVRIAFYIQTVMGGILCIFDPDLVPANAAVSYFTTATVLVASLLANQAQELSFFDGMIVNQLSILPMFLVGFQPSRLVYLLLDEILEKWRRKRNGDTQGRNQDSQGHTEKEKDQSRIRTQECLIRTASQILGIAYLVLWCVWGKVLYSDPLHFGRDELNAECIANLDETSWGREFGRLSDPRALKRVRTGIFLLGAIAGVCTLMELGFTIRFFWAAWRGIPRIVDCSTHEAPRFPTRSLGAFAGISAFFKSFAIQLRCIWQGINNNSHSDRFFSRPEAERHKFVIRLAKKVVHLMMFFGIISSQSFLISSIERSIATSGIKPNDHPWSYGQLTTLATAVFQAVVSLFSSKVVLGLAGKGKGWIRERCGAKVSGGEEQTNPPAIEPEPEASKEPEGLHYTPSH